MRYTFITLTTSLLPKYIHSPFFESLLKAFLHFLFSQHVVYSSLECAFRHCFYEMYLTHAFVASETSNEFIFLENMSRDTYQLCISNKLLTKLTPIVRGRHRDESTVF